MAGVTEGDRKMNSKKTLDEILEKIKEFESEINNRRFFDITIKVDEGLAVHVELLLKYRPYAKKGKQ